MKNKKIIKQALGSTIYFKILWVILVVLKINPIISQKTSLLFYILLLYGAIIIIYDLLTDIEALRNKYIVPFAMFLAFMAISTLANYDKGFMSNLKTLGTTVIQFLVIGRMDLRSSHSEIIKEIKKINLVIVVPVTIISLISLYLFTMGISGFYTIKVDDMFVDELGYYYGMAYNNRLVGIFSNPNEAGAICVIAILASLINLLFSQTTKKTKSAYFVSIAINLICLSLSASRGALLSFFVALFLFIFLISMYRMRKRIVVRSINALLFVCICVMLQYGIIGIVNNYGPIIPAAINGIKEDVGIDVSNELSTRERISLISDGDSKSLLNESSGRTTLWEAGLNTAKKNMFFGVGKAKLREIVIENWHGIPLSKGIIKGSLHNIYIETLVSYGLPTFLSFLLLICWIFFDYIKKLIQFGRNQVKYFYLGVGILTILAFNLINNIVESKMLFQVNIYSFLFILYLGYAMYFIQFDLHESNENGIYYYVKKLQMYFKSKIHKIFWSQKES
ncbi:MAG: O-antigen ligase family protein [Caldicoprobacterales bacterium]